MNVCRKLRKKNERRKRMEQMKALQNVKYVLLAVAFVVPPLVMTGHSIEAYHSGRKIVLPEEPQHSTIGLDWSVCHVGHRVSHA